MQARPEEFSKLSMSSPAISRPLPLVGYAPPLADAPPLESMSPDSAAEWPPEAIVDGRKLGKGLRWALTIEGIAALIFYGAWYLRHLLR